MGIVKNKKLTILVDSHITHNYVHINFIKELNIFVYPRKDLTVKVNDGHHANEKGRFHKISIQIH